MWDINCASYFQLIHVVYLIHAECCLPVKFGEPGGKAKNHAQVHLQTSNALVLYSPQVTPIQLFHDTHFHTHTCTHTWMHTYMHTLSHHKQESFFQSDAAMLGQPRTLGWIADLYIFRHLVSLSLSDNCLDQFPLSLCSLKTLQELDISSNNLRSVPHEIQNLTK